MEYFWKKKTIISFILSVFVFWIHISSFGHYLFASGQGTDSAAKIFVNCLNVFFSNTFVRLAVPLFFILSGAALFRDYDNKKYFSKLKTRVWSLLIPYLIWNTLGMIFEIITSYSFVSQYFAVREKFVITVPNLLAGIFFYKCNGPFWFICTLIIFVIFTPVFDLLAKNKVTSFLSLAAFVVLSQFEIPFLSTVIKGTDTLVYYMAGCILGRHFLGQFSERSSKKLLVCSACVFVLCTAVWFVRGMGVFDLPASLTTVFLTAYALSFWYAADMADLKNRKPKPFMGDSFFVYAMHINLSAVLAKLLYMILPKGIIWSIPNFVLTTVLTLCIILVFAFVLRKYLNPLYLILSGKKKRKVG